MTELIMKNPSWWNKRSTLEKSLLSMLGWIILATIILAIGLFLLILRYPEPQVPKCATPGCVETASQILNNMKSSVDPCENFYEFACGNFANIVEIPKAQGRIDPLGLTTNKVIDQLRIILEEPIQSDEPTSFNLGKKFYNACIHEENIGLESIKNIFSDLGGWPIIEEDNWKEEDFDWIQFIYKLRNKGLPFAQFINIAVEVDNKNPKQRILQLYQGKLILNKEKFNEDIKTNRFLQAYNQYMIDIAIIFGANETTAETELMDVFLFQKKLAEISLSQIELSNRSSLYNPMTIDEIQNLHPSIPWLEYINTILSPAMQVDSKEIIINQMPSHITKLEELLQETSNKTIANYIFWTIFLDLINEKNMALPKEIQDAQQKLRGSVGIKEAIPRWKTCFSITHENFKLITGSMYVRKYFNKESKKKILEIVDDIQETFNEILQTNDWMDEETKKKALKKLKAVDKHIAYPDELLDDQKLDNYYKVLKINENSFLESMILLDKFWTDYHFKNLRKPVNKTDWTEHGDAAKIGASYEVSENSITFSAGILQGNFFSKDRPNYMNYGAIGFIIGHEFTHGFDHEGRQYNEDGVVTNWWHPSTEKAFLTKAQCIIDQYSNYHISEINKNINGVLTQGENIADNGGVKQAYLAYKKWLQRNKNQTEEELQLPGLPYTPQQMFWISMASIWCANENPDILKIMVDTEVHAPNAYRVIGSISNQPEFAQDFNCPAGSKMNSINKCQVW